MSWGDELVVIRRFVRDPNGTIWSDAFLRHLWNDVSQDFQHKTSLLEDLATQRIPGLYQASYMHDFEWRFLSTDQSQFYQCLNLHDEGVFCHRWEPQEVAAIDADVSDYGFHFTHPWEAYTGGVPGDLLKNRFPADCDTLLYMAYDEEPIDALSKKQVSSMDPSFAKTEGLPFGWYPYDETDNSYVLYPRPSTSFVNEIAGDGVALFADGDTEDTALGTIAVREGSEDTAEGVATDIVDTADNVFMIYRATPLEMRSVSDEPSFPVFIRKYLRAGVISRAYGGNNDGRIKSLSEFWGMRYMLGVQFTKRYLRNKRQDRDYRLVTQGRIVNRTIRHPRLPSSYPAVNPL